MRHLLLMLNPAKIITSNKRLFEQNLQYLALRSLIFQILEILEIYQRHVYNASSGLNEIFGSEFFSAIICMSSFSLLVQNNF